MRDKKNFFFPRKKITERWCTFIRFVEAAMGIEGRVTRKGKRYAEMIYCNLVCQVDSTRQCSTKCSPFVSFFFRGVARHRRLRLPLVIIRMSFPLMTKRFKIIRKRAFIFVNGTSVRWSLFSCHRLIEVNSTLCLFRISSSSSPFSTVPAHHWIGNIKANLIAVMTLRCQHADVSDGFLRWWNFSFLPATSTIHRSPHPDVHFPFFMTCSGSVTKFLAKDPARSECLAQQPFAMNEIPFCANMVMRETNTKHTVEWDINFWMKSSCHTITIWKAHAHFRM